MIKKQAPSNKQVLNSSFQLSDRFSMRKVLVVSPIVRPEIGGPATYVGGLVSLTSEFKFKVIAFQNRKILGAAQNKAKRVENDDHRVALVSTKGSFSGRQFRLIRRIWGEVEDADLIYALDPLTVGVASMVVGWFKGVGVVIRFAGDVGWEVAVSHRRVDVGLENYLKTRRRRLDWRYRLQKWALAGAKAVVVPGEYLRGLIVRFYGVSSDRVRVIRNAVELSGSELRIRNYELGGRLQIVAVGRLVKWKNFDVLIKAFARLAAGIQESEVRSQKEVTNMDRLKLVIVGEGPERGRLESLAKELGVENQVEFLGRLSKEETARVVGGSMGLVLPSSYEGMSHVLLEAMAWGCPVVASDIEANREIIDNGRTGWLFKSGSEEDLARVMEKLTGDEQLRKRLAKSAKREVEKYNWESHIEKLGQLFGRIKNQEL